MSSVDNRIVRMQFDNKAFESGVSTTKKSLAELEKSLQLEGGTKGLESVEKASRSFTMDPVAAALEGISDKFTALSVIGVTALQNLTNSAIDLGKKLVSAIYDPLVNGGKQRALNIEQAKFQFEGLGIDIEKAMAAASYAVNDTAFSLDQAARAAGQFAASGLRDFDEMGTALRAISGVAAQTSSSYDDIANVFTTVAGNGRLMGQQLLQLSTRGINAAATLAEYLGKSEAEVRKMVSAGQIDFKTFYTAMDEAFGEHAKKANETFSGSMANVRANLSRIGADVATSSLENFKNVNNALIPVLKELHKALGPAIDGINEFQTLVANIAIEKINNINFTWLTDSIPAAIAVVKNLGDALLSIADPIRQAYRNIFPPATAESFLDAANKLKELTAGLKISAPVAEDLRRSFAGLFAVVDIVRKGFIALGSGLLNVIQYFTPVGTGFLGVTASIGDFLVALNSAIGQTDAFNRAIQAVGKVLTPAANLIKNLFTTITGAIKNFASTDTTGLASFAETASKALTPLYVIGKGIQTVFLGVVDIFRRIGQVMAPAVDLIATSFRNLKTAIVESLKAGDFSPILNLINGGLFAGILYGITNFINELTRVTAGGGLLKRFKSLLSGVSQSLQAFTGSIKADTLKKIATAIAILAASLLVLALIPADKLTASLAAVSLLMTELFTTMGVFEKIMGSSGFKNMGKITISMIGLSAAVLLLSVACKSLAKLDWDGIFKGLTGVAGLMAVLVAAAKTMSSSTGQLIKGAGGLILFAAAVVVLTKAVEKLSALNIEELTKGLVGVGALMAEIALFTKLTDKMSISSALGIIALAAAMHIFVSAVAKFGALDIDVIIKGLASVGAVLLELAIFTKIVGGTKGMISIGVGLIAVAAAMQIMTSVMQKLSGLSWDEIARGLAALAGSLTALTLALNFMPKNIVGIGIGLIGVATAMLLLSNALTTFSGLSWDELARGLVAMAGSLGILAVALIAMTGTLGGAAALLIASSALGILAGVLFLFGSMDIGTIVGGLLAIAGVFGVIAIGAALLAPAGAALLVFSAAALIFGAGVLAAGAGIAALAVGLSLLATSGAPGVAALAGLLVEMTAFVVLTPGILVLGAALLVFGVSVIALAAGLAVLAAAFTLLGVSAAIGMDALNQLAEMVTEIAPLITDFLALGAAFIVFGAGLAVTAAATLVFGAALVVLGAGLLVVAQAGPEGVEGLLGIADGAKQMLPATPALLAVGAALVVFGAGALAAGAGALTAGVGFISLAAGMALVTALGPDTAQAIGDIVVLAAEMLLAAPALLALAAAFVVFGPAALIGGAGALVAGEGLKAMADGLNALNKVKAGYLEILAEVTDISKDLAKNAVGMAAAGAALLVLGGGAKALGEGLSTLGTSASDITKATTATTAMNESLKTLMTEATKSTNATITTIKSFTNKMYETLNGSIGKVKTASLGIMNDGLIAGIKDRVPAAETQVATLMNAVINAIRSRYSDLFSAGSYAADGFISGLNSKVNAAASAAAALASAASNAINSNLRIKSPSRVTMESGGWAGEGFIIGLHPYIALAGTVAEEIGENTIDSLAHALDIAGDIIDSELEADPVITPVIDLSQVETGMNTMRAMFDQMNVATSSAATRAAVAASTPGRFGEATTAQEIRNEYKLEQTINSPTQPLRQDIYRDTKNLFALLREVVDT